MEGERGKGGNNADVDPTNHNRTPPHRRAWHAEPVRHPT